MKKAKPKICLLPTCGKEFEPARGKKYCCPEHQIKHQSQLRQQHKVESEMRKKGIPNGTIKKLTKFYELFGKDHECDLCAISFTDALQEYGVPFFFELQNGIKDYRVLEVSSWHRYCLKCYLDILAIRE